MIRTKITSLTIAAVTVAGINLISTDANAQGWRNMWGSWGQPVQVSATEKLRKDAYSIDRINNQSVYTFSREGNFRCSCSKELLVLLKKNVLLSGNVVTATKGKCKCAVKKSACALNTNTALIAKQSKKVRNLSCVMNTNISEAVKIARRIHKNADKFEPQTSSFTNNRNNGSGYGRDSYTNNRDRNRNGNRNTNIENADRDDLIAMLRSLLGGRTVPASDTVNRSRDRDRGHNTHAGHDHH